MLVLLVDGDLLRIITTGKRNRQTTYTLPIPSHLAGEGEAKAFADWFATQIKSLKLPTRNACLALTDPDILHPYYELPGVSPREAAEAVQLKLSADCPITPEAWHRDFVLYPATEHCGPAATVACTNKTTIEKYSLACKHAGLRLRGITSAEWLLQQYVISLGPSAAEHDVVAIHWEDKLKLLALREGRLLKTYTHSCTRSGDTPPVTAAVARIAAALENADETFEFRSLLWLTPHSKADWYTPLREIYPSLQCQISASEAALPAQAIAQGCQTWLAAPKPKKIDLSAPKTAPNRIVTKLVLVAALLLLVGSLALQQYRGLWDQQAALNDQLAEMQMRLEALPAPSPDRTDQVAVFQEVQALRANRIDWLRQIASLSDKLPNRRDAFLTELQLLSATPETPAIISARGVASSQTEIMDMNRKFAESAEQATLVPSSIQASGRTDGFPYRFRLELRLSADDASANATPKLSRFRYAPSNP